MQSDVQPEQESVVEKVGTSSEGRTQAKADIKPAMPLCASWGRFSKVFFSPTAINILSAPSVSASSRGARFCQRALRELSCRCVQDFWTQAPWYLDATQSEQIQSMIRGFSVKRSSLGSRSDCEA